MSEFVIYIASPSSDADFWVASLHKNGNEVAFGTGESEEEARKNLMLVWLDGYHRGLTTILKAEAIRIGT